MPSKPIIGKKTICKNPRAVKKQRTKASNESTAFKEVQESSCARVLKQLCVLQSLKNLENYLYFYELWCFVGVVRYI